MAHVLAKLRGMKAEIIKQILTKDASQHALEGLYPEHLWQNVGDILVGRMLQVLTPPHPSPVRGGCVLTTPSPSRRGQGVRSKSDSRPRL